MKKIVLLFIPILICGIIFESCESNEKKAEKLIKESLFKILYDFSSYEAIETKIESTMSNIYMDENILKYAELLSVTIGLRDDYKEYMNSEFITSTERESYNNKYIESSNRVEELQKIIKTLCDEYVPVSVLRASHKFRCKNKGGNYDIANYTYIFDKDLKDILFYSAEKDEYNDMMKIIIYKAKEK